MTHDNVPGEGDHPAELARARRVLSARGEAIPEAALRILARDVLRRLSRSHARRPPGAVIDAVRVRQMAVALVSADPDDAPRLLAEVRSEGHGLEDLHQMLVAAAVRELGRQWDEDEISLADVMVGTGRVYRLLRQLRDAFIADRAISSDSPSALFATVPGELHTLGAVMAADHFRARGWSIDLRIAVSQDEIVEAGRSHVIVVFATSLPALIVPLARLVVALRVENPAAYVLVAGGIAEVDPDVAALVDADAAVPDLPGAEQCLEEALDRLTRPPSPPVRR